VPVQLTVGFVHSAPYIFPFCVSGFIGCVNYSFFFLHSFVTTEFFWLQVNHYAATFFEYFHDYEKSLYHYELAIRKPILNFVAEVNYINLKMKTSPPGSYSPVFHLSEMLSMYHSCHYAVQTLCHRGFYLYK
jgi:hypothetical protein